MTAVSANQQNLTIRMVNGSLRPLDLRQAELRYWCGQSTGREIPAQQGRTAEVDYASTGPGTVTPAEGIDREHEYVALRFTAVPPASATLAPYGGVAVIMLRLNRRDWTSYSPAGDWSFLPSPLLTLAPHLTLALGGHPVWGYEPSRKDRR